MAMFRGHLWGGIVAVVPLVFAVQKWCVPTIIPELTFFDVAIMFGCSILGGLWPDIDTKSVGQGLFYKIFFVVDIFLIIEKKFIESAILGLLAMTPLLGKHRGWTHRWWTALLIPSSIIIFHSIFSEELQVLKKPPFFSGKLLFTSLHFYLAAVTGYFSHLVLDKKIK